jgi:hypothetical protein
MCVRRVESAGNGRRLCQAISSLALAILVTVWLAACGAGGGSHVVVRVGGKAIDAATVEHWTHVFRSGGPVDRPSGTLHGSPRAQALAFLISTNWLLGEAARQGLRSSGHVVEQTLDDRREADGGSEFEQALRASGQTTADVKLQIEAELAAKAIQRALASRAANATEGEVVAYYTHNRSRFRVREVRMTELIEDLPNPAAAAALVRRIGTGSRFSKRAFHESLEFYEITGDAEKAPLLDAIFRARVGVVSRPMRLNGLWTVFIVRRIVPARIEPLTAARGTVVRLLRAARKQALMTAFLSAYRGRWTALTSCRAGYVVQGCSQYKGPLQTQPNPLTTAEPDTG